MVIFVPCSYHLSSICFVVFGHTFFFNRTMCFLVSLSFILLNSENQDIYLKFFCENNNWFLCPPSHISFFISNIFFRGSSNPKKNITTTGQQMNYSKRGLSFSRKNKNLTQDWSSYIMFPVKSIKYTELILFGKPHVQYQVSPNIRFNVKALSVYDLELVMIVSL